MGKQDDSYFGIVHRAEQAQLKAERSPAPNTPTPELEPVAWAFDRPEAPYQFWTTNPEVDNLKREKLIPLVRHDQAAATIAKLTVERDTMLRELKAATGHDDGLIAIRHLVLRATQAEDYITAWEAKP